MAAVPTFRARSTVATASLVATVSGADIGAASPDRIVVVSIAWISNSHPATSVTIGGVSATALIQTFHNAANDKCLEMWAAVVPDGTTADIVATFPTNQSVSIAHYTVEGSRLPISDSGANTGSAASIALSTVTVPTDGCGIWTFCNQSGGTAVTWTNATENFDDDSAAATMRHSGATTTTAGTPTVTADGATNDQALVGVAFAPPFNVPRKMFQYRQRRV